MPIATPEVYAQMFDAAKAGSFAYPAINVSSSQTLNAALQGFTEAGSDGIIQISTGGAEYASGPTIKDKVTGAVALATYAHEVAKNYPVDGRAAHRPLPQEQPGQLRPAADRHLHRARQGRRPAAVPVAHVGRLGRRARGEPLHRRGAARPVRGGEHHPRDRGGRRRRRGGRRQPRDQREALHDRRRRPAHRRGARHRRAGPLPDRPDLRQRARRLQARLGQAAPGGPQGHPAAGRRQGRQAEPLRPRLPRRLGLARSRRSRRPSTTASSR